MKCIICEGKIKTRSKFCNECGITIPRCKDCDTIFTGSKFCSECGGKNDYLMNKIGAIYSFGDEIDKNDSLAFKWYKKAASLVR